MKHQGPQIAYKSASNLTLEHLPPFEPSFRQATYNILFQRSSVFTLAHRLQGHVAHNQVPELEYQFSITMLVLVNFAECQSIYPTNIIKNISNGVQKKTPKSDLRISAEPSALVQRRRKTRWGYLLSWHLLPIPIAIQEKMSANRFLQSRHRLTLRRTVDCAWSRWEFVGGVWGWEPGSFNGVP